MEPKQDVPTHGNAMAAETAESVSYESAATAISQAVGFLDRLGRQERWPIHLTQARTHLGKARRQLQRFGRHRT